MKKILIVLSLSFAFISCSNTKGLAGSFGVIYDNPEHDTLQLEIYPDGFIVFSHQSDGFCGEYHVGFYVIATDSNNHYTLKPSSISNNNIPLNVTKKKKVEDGTELVFKELSPFFQWKLILFDTVMEISEKKLMLEKEYTTFQLMGLFKKENRYVHDTILTERKQIFQGYNNYVTIDKRYYSSIHYMGTHKEGIIFNMRGDEIFTTTSGHKMKRLKKKYFVWEKILKTDSLCH
ncbi:MAG: hypothetical protein J6X58_06400 [Bacteroidales bacterium]|nr:hypothetical protein [Bacteroidales bacterium]